MIKKNISNRGFSSKRSSRCFFASAILAVTFIVLVGSILPLSTQAQSPVSSGQSTASNNTIFGMTMPTLIVCGQDNNPANRCTWNSLILLVNNAIMFLFYISIPLTTVSFAYAGFRLMTSGSSEDGRKAAKNLAINTLIGFALMCGAYAIVYYITAPFINTSGGYSVLSPSTNQ